METWRLKRRRADSIPSFSPKTTWVILCPHSHDQYLSHCNSYWELGIGDWGKGKGDWGKGIGYSSHTLHTPHTPHTPLSPIPVREASPLENPRSPIPN
ncbi:hypothetical protein BLD44_028220 [Mastigocladus laminosus UU774]|nr:hypothetical protein BLD44_028220 [Mastigocladus laminosus UU774]